MSVERPTSEQIGELYDRMGPLYATLWGGDIHVGVWMGDDDDASLAEAQDRLTQMLIERTPIGKGQRLLDVGCGTGKSAIRMASATGSAVVGITVSGFQVEEAVRQARTAGLEDRVSFRLADVMDLPFDDDAFDAAWAVESILHVPDRLRALQEIHRVLAPGGKLVLTDVVNEIPLTDSERALVYPALGVSSLASIESYPGLLQRAGWEVREILDLGSRIERTATETMDLLVRKRADLLRFYDQEFLDTLTDAWSTITAVHAAKMGYVLIVAGKVATTA